MADVKPEILVPEIADRISEIAIVTLFYLGSSNTVGLV